MTYYGNSSYDFTAIAEVLAGDEAMLDYLIIQGTSVPTAAKSPILLPALYRALDSNQAEEMSHNIVSVAVAALNLGTLSAGDITALLNKARTQNPALFMSLFDNGLIYTLTERVNDDKATPEEAREIIALALAAMESTDSEHTAATIASNLLRKSNHASETATEILSRVIGTAEKFATVEGSSTEAYLSSLTTAASRRPGGSYISYGSILRPLNDALETYATRDLFNTADNSPVGKALNMHVFAVNLSDSDGKFAIDYFKSNRPTARQAANVFMHPANPEALTEVARWALDNKNEYQYLSSLALNYTLVNQPDIADQHMETITGLLDEQFAIYSDPDTRTVQSALDSVITVRANIRYLPLIIERAKALPSTLSERNYIVALNNRILERVSHVAHPGNEVSSDFARELWDYIGTLPVSAYDKEAMDGALLNLIHSGLIDQARLKARATGRTKVAQAARTATAPAPADAPVKTVETNTSGWDERISDRTSIEEYLDAAKTAGLSPIAALALYSTDARIDFNARVAARKDLIGFLNIAPHYADDIPDKAWTGLSRVRGSLGLSMELATHMTTLGPIAAKVGSKNLVKSALL